MSKQKELADPPENLTKSSQRSYAVYKKAMLKKVIVNAIVALALFFAVIISYLTHTSYYILFLIAGIFQLLRAILVFVKYERINSYKVNRLR